MNWQKFLEEFNRDLLCDADIKSSLPPAVIENYWLGNHGATDLEIRDVEQKLGLVFPASYKGFLQASNGWLSTGYDENRLYSVHELIYPVGRSQHLLQCFVDGVLNAGMPRPTDEEYYNYSDIQDSMCLRVEYFSTVLEISDSGDASILLLNPEVVADDGEWEAWFHASWLPGAMRYRSFQDMMIDMHKSFLQNRTNLR